jgi:hypothetical protein
MTARGGPAALDIRALAEALADVLAQRGLVVSIPATTSARVLDATEVARLLGRDRRWVYDHAGELGAFRYGDGPRARLGFDLVAVERWKRERQIKRRAAARPAVNRPARAVGGRAVSLIPYEAPGGAS